MKAVCVAPGHTFSTTIWWRGLGDGLSKLGHQIVGYPLNLYIDFYNLVSSRIPSSEGVGLGAREICNLACQPLVIDVLRDRPDWVIIITGQYVHELTWKDLGILKDLIGIKIACVLTESPYLDDQHQRFVDYCDVVTTNDLYSANEYGWDYLPPGYNAQVYRHREVDSEYHSQVFFAGSGYEERLNLLATVDWEALGVEPVLFGSFDDRYSASAPLRQFVKGPLFEDGEMEELAKWTSGADIVLNFHRDTVSHYTGETVSHALSMNPRCYEAAGAGSFLLTDDSRPEVRQVFGETVGYYKDPQDLEEAIVYWLAHPEDREARAKRANRIVMREHSWDDRAKLLESYLL